MDSKEKCTPDFSIENEYISKGYKLICGVDEAGRGPLVGRVYAGACILPAGLYIEGLNDSKKLSEKKRELLYDEIKSECITCATAFCTAEEIDEINILNAAMLAMKRAIEKLDPKPDFCLVDGNCTRGFGENAVSVVKGDSISCSIAAASILAKVERDRYCGELDKLYPEYGFGKHKGYPTKDHYAAIEKYGPCPEHRKSFKLYKK